MEGFNPLLEEEQIRLKLQRERNNKISKIMGDYLLRGYKMLGTTCNKCQTILLKDRQGEDYCIGCVEVDVPDVTQVHTTRQMTNQRQNNLNDQGTEENNLNGRGTEVSMVGVDSQMMETSIKTIQQQIQWTNDSLSRPELSLEHRTQLVMHMKTCYETLTFLMKSNTN